MRREHQTEPAGKAKKRPELRESVPEPTRCSGEVHPILQLQRILGNRRVAGLIQASRLTPSGRILPLQRRLTVGAADDQYEEDSGGGRSPTKSGEEALGAHAYAASAARGTSRAVQRFGSLEHQGVANEGSGHQKYQKVGLALNQGDLTMLRGDYFEEKDLLEFWQRPGASGTLTNSQDEIIYAIHHATDGKDSRFGKDGPWNQMTFSDDVTKAVKDRYYALANKNYSHFVNPGFGIDARGMPIGGAGATYRDAHERAIVTAFSAGAGAAGMSIDDALITEAMGQHFLTDAFAAGHVSTRRGKIEKDWDARYPNFPYQIFNRIVRDMTDFLAATGKGVLTDAAREVGRGDWSLFQKTVEAKVRKIMSEKLATKGQITLGKIIGVVAHDYDNQQGLSFVNRVGQHWLGYGDSNLDKQPMGPRQKGEISHREIIVMAVKAGVDDIQHAYSIGKTGKKLSYPDLYDAVRHQSAPPAFPSAFYAPEMYMPQLDPAADQEQNIESDSIENLFETRIRRNGPSYKELIEANARSGSIHDELQDIASDKDLKGPMEFYAGTVTVYPKEAFENTVIRPLENDPTLYLKYVMRSG